MILTKYVMYRGKKKPVSELSPTCGYKVDVQCPDCGEVRSVFYRSVAKAGHTVCQACVMKSRREFLEIGAKSGRLTVIGHATKSGYSICKCKCGNTTTVANYQLKTKRTRSCGCLVSEHIRRVAHQPSGKKHWNWRGGISRPRHLVMSKKKYRDWRTGVFERDAYTCQKCGQVGRELRAHHIFSYSSYPDLAYDTDNGITLCDSCHREFHSLNGFDTNRKQLDAFLEV